MTRRKSTKAKRHEVVTATVRDPERPTGAPPLLFETAWEVCSQTGGVYTVLRSKAPVAVDEWGDNYWLIGPYREASARIEFEPRLAKGAIAEVVDYFRSRGIVMHTGHWLITGRPQTILIDLQSVADRMLDQKYQFWEQTGVGSLGSDPDVDSVLAFGCLIADFISALQDRLGERPLLVHSHEWQGAAALPLLKSRNTKCATVFTTHATLVGRSLSSANVDLYEHLRHIDPYGVANEHGISTRYHIERAAARSADVFTTVSGITGLESEQFLGRKPDVLVPNGLNVEKLAAPYQFQNLHRENKERLHEFVMGHFFPSYTFDLDRTLYIFSAGRYEYQNKGFNVVIEALHQLNQRLRNEPRDVTVIAFLIAPAANRSLNVVTLNRKAMFNEIREICESISTVMGRRLFHTVVENRIPTADELLDESQRVHLKRMLHAWHQGPPPTIVTHDMVYDADDPILCQLRYRHLINDKDDPVKVVFHPEFITSTSPVLGLEYDEFVRGCNMGVFPSYYEPWGYTPMECVVRGIPSITSDLSGFGAYVMEQIPNHDEQGIYVARRRGRAFHETVDQVTNWLYALTHMTRRQRIELRHRVERNGDHFDWTNLIRHYRDAHHLALARRYPEQTTIANAPVERPVQDITSSAQQG